MRTPILVLSALLVSAALVACSSSPRADEPSDVPSTESTAAADTTPVATTAPTAEATAEPTATASAAPTAAPVATSPVAPTDKRLVGTWDLSGVQMTFNSKGRVKMSVSPTCVGSYFLEGDKLDIKYDPGATGCSWERQETFTLTGDALGFAGAKYKRVDKKDDASF